MVVCGSLVILIEHVLLCVLRASSLIMHHLYQLHTQISLYCDFHPHSDNPLCVGYHRRITTLPTDDLDIA
jgi:hypothetical protein